MTARTPKPIAPFIFSKRAVDSINRLCRDEGPNLEALAEALLARESLGPPMAASAPRPRRRFNRVSTDIPS